MRGVPPLLRSFLVVVCRPGLTVGNAVIKLGYLMERVMKGSENNRGQMSVIYNQDNVYIIIVMNSKVRVAAKGS